MNNDQHEAEARISRLENWADLSAWLIVGGLALEVLEATRFFDSIMLIVRWGAATFNALVMLGVAGEILFARKARSLSERLRRSSDERIAEAELAAEKLRTRTIALLRSGAPRVISDGAFEAVKPFGAFRFELAFTNEIDLDPEALALGHQIFSLLARADWSITKTTNDALVGREVRMFAMLPVVGGVAWDAAKALRRNWKRARSRRGSSRWASSDRARKTPTWSLSM
jgi:hypothetical protein